jgi:HSP20 family protein
MAQWNLFADMDALRDEIDRTIETLVRPGAIARAGVSPGREPRRYPLINLLEDKDNLYIEALTPGVDPKTINVTSLQNRLTLSEERR